MPLIPHLKIMLQSSGSAWATSTISPPIFRIFLRVGLHKRIADDLQFHRTEHNSPDESWSGAVPRSASPHPPIEESSGATVRERLSEPIQRSWDANALLR